MRTLFRILLLSFAVVLPARAVDYYVATNGNDAADGLTPATAWSNVQTSANRIVGGDTLWVRGGTYRGKVSLTNNTGTVANRIRIFAYSNEVPVLKGSRVVDGWQLYTNDVWVRAGWSNYSQQVFVDDKLMQQLGWPNAYIATRTCTCVDWFYIPHGYSCNHINPVTKIIDIGNPVTNMPVDSFYYETNSGALYLRLAGGAAPTGKVVEASTELGVFFDNSTSGNLWVKGLSFRHASTFTYTFEGWPGVLIGPGGRIEDCEISWCDGSGLTLRSNAEAVRCVIGNNGVLGIACNSVTNVLVSECLVYSNNYRRCNESVTGGIRFIPDAGATVERNEVRDNWCTGIWFDTCHANHPIVVRDNLVRNNMLPPNPAGDTTPFAAKGIFIEFSSRADVYNNLVVSNGNIGIHLSASQNCNVFNNTITGTRNIPGVHRGLYAFVMDNPQPGYPVVSNRVFNNVIFNNLCDFDMFTVVTNGATIYDIDIRNNLYHRSVGAGTIAPSASAVLICQGRGTYTSVSNWSAATGWDPGGLQVAPGLTNGFRPSPTSPVLDHGLTGPFMTSDHGGSPRPVDGNGDSIARPDLGAFELQVAGSVRYVDAASTNASAPFDTPGTAATDPIAALAAAGDGDLVLVEPGTYLLSTTLVINAGVTLRSARGAGSTVLDAQGNCRVLSIANENAAVDGFTIRNGASADDGGGVHTVEGAVLQNCTIVSNTAARHGGGVYAAAGASVERCLITRNAAVERGGGLFAEAGVRLDFCDVNSNQGGDGGGLYLGESATLTRSIVRLNVAPGGSGGGAMASGGASIQMSAFVANTADIGGGLHLASGAVILDSDVNGNIASRSAGLYASNATLRRVIIRDNTTVTGEGGGASLIGGIAENCAVVRNSAATHGGGCYVTDAGLVNFCTIVTNSAPVGGGIAAGGPATISSSIVRFNTAASSPDLAELSGGSIAASHSALWPVVSGEGNTTNAPVFLNAADFRLQPFSPGVDGGRVAGAPTNDLLALGRIADGDLDGDVEPDMGCYEQRGVHLVRPSGSTPVSPYLTWSNAATKIGDAINASGNGDAVMVSNGVYVVTVSPVINRPLTVKSIGGASNTIVDGGGTSRGFVLAHPLAVLDGFTIRNSRADAGAGIYVINGRVRNSRIEGNVSTGNLGGAFAYVPSPPRYYCRYAEDIVIHEGGGGVALVGNGVLENCIVVSNRAVYGGGVLTVGGGTVQNATVVGNTATNGGGSFSHNGGVIRNTILQFNAATNHAMTGTSAVYTAVCATPAPPGAGHVDADPLFVQLAGGDFNLSEPSPCIDAGVATGSPSTDFRGVGRPLDGNADSTAAHDIGAYEFAGATVDADGDGLSDAAEAIAGSHVFLRDTDGDFFSDFDEVQAGTFATNALSYLAALAPNLGGDSGLLIQWPSVAGRLYSVHATTNALSIYAPVATQIVATPPWNVYTSPVIADQRLYRIVAEPLP